MKRFVSRAEAIAALGICERTIKKWKKQGRIETIEDPSFQGRFLYRIDDKIPRKTAETYRILSMWDVHVPDADGFALKAVLDFARDQQPDHIVLGGDFLELESCSMHGGNANPHALLDEIKAGRKTLERIRNTCPDAKLTYLEGNHETRLQRVVASSLPTFSGALDVPTLLDLRSLECEWVPFRKLWQPDIRGVTGHLAYTHGEWATLHHAKKHLDMYGMSVRYGHTHRPQTTTRGFGDGRVLYAIGSPCLRTLDPSWIGPHNGWLHGFGFDEFFHDGTFTAHNVVMWDRRFSFGGKMYGRV